MLDALLASGVRVEPGKRYTGGEVNAILHAARCLAMGGEQAGAASSGSDPDAALHMPTLAAGVLADAVCDRVGGEPSRVLTRGGYHMRLGRAHRKIKAACVPECMGACS